MTETDKNIDQFKKERTNLRRLFTTACNQFKDLQASDDKSKQISVIYNKIFDKAERLFQVDEKLGNIADFSDTEYDEIESYRDNFIEIKTEYEKYTNKNFDDANSVVSASGTNLRLPKLNLKEFDLSTRTWVAFWGQFSRIDDDTGLREEDKFQYLLCSLKPKTKARDIADSYPPCKENYAKVIDHLKSRFGRDDLLIEVYIRDLLNLVANRSTVKLGVLYDQLGMYLRALETLGVTTANYAAMLYPVVESCLPIEILKAWDRYRLNREIKEKDSLIVTKEKLLEDLMVFLRHEVEGEEHRTLAENSFNNYAKSKRDFNNYSQKSEPTAAALVSSVERSIGKTVCIFCDKIHLSQECTRASSMSKDERKNHVLKKKCCLVCLKPGHFANRCRSTVRCIICSRRHYTILCPDLQIKSSVAPSSEKFSSPDSEKLTTLITQQPSLYEIYLKTIMIYLCHNGKRICVRAILDDGSHRSYIEEDLAHELQLSPAGKEILSQGLFGGETTPAAKHNRYTVMLESMDQKYSKRFSFLDQPKICATLPRIKDKNLLSELSSRGIILNDVGSDIPSIQVLLGADVLGSILTGRIEVLKKGISAIETSLGWTVMGLGRKKNVASMISLNLQNFEIQKMWDLEILGITDPIVDKAKEILDSETLLHFQETLTINEHNRYEVALPWIVGHPPLPDNYDLAFSRLKNVTKRLLKNNYFQAYNEVFRHWEAEGIIEEIKHNDVEKLAYYLPHRPVIKMSSTTTKIRPVFDASVKTFGYASLNDCLSTGPSLTQQIPPLLNRFRMGAIGVSADIKQAFLQLSIRAEDRDVLRFLWWEDNECSKVKIYKHLRVVFGVTSSPFLLNASISHHLRLDKFQGEDLQPTLNILKEGFYVDNLITSVPTKEEYFNLRAQAVEIMKEGCFDLRCWTCTGDPEENQTILGLKWNTATDELTCGFQRAGEVQNIQSATKRSLLSLINSIYDPIGYSCPAMLLPKLLLQEAWIRKLEWDEELPTDLQSQFESWFKHLHVAGNCAIPRRMLHGGPEDSTLHIFSDASANFYACCAFLRCENQSQVFINLVAARSRIAPMIRPSIPRMELLGAVLAARLAKSILESCNLPFRTIFWTDSMVVLAWILRKEPWHTFVGNRVKEIREITDISCWRHIPGELNPADLPSRSCNWSDLQKGKWWTGPDWLKGPESSWPHTNVTCPDEALTERRKIILSAANMQSQENFSTRLTYFSKYFKILRLVAWILRFYKNCRQKEERLTGILTSDEIRKAEETIIKLLQGEWTHEQERYKNIQFYSRDNILRVKSKLILGNDSEEFTWPIVLPDHEIIRRLIFYTHEQLHHSGVQTTLSCLRERFWIPRGRRIVREVLRSCVICKRHSSKQVIPETPPLPPDRVNRVAAFQVTGIDLAGPLYLREGKKAWIVLFTCGVYRAIHLELVTGLSAEIFIQALRRFFARRGRSSIFYTDNGTNFSGTFRALQSLDWEEIQKKSAALQIKWYFSPPTAPWYGGWWERMVRSVKELLRRNLGRASLNYEEMSTLLCDIEATINSRPLTYLSDDPNELKPLTPAHFIQDIRQTETIDLDQIDKNCFSNRARYLQSLKERLRLRFKEEYLAELIRYPKTKVRQQAIQNGDIVLVGSDNTKRIGWPLARVDELFTGKDGKERVARLRLADKEIIRPVQRLYPLEVRAEDLSASPSQNLHPSDQPVQLSGQPVQLSDQPLQLSDIGEENHPITPNNSVKTRCGRKVVKPKRFL